MTEFQGLCASCGGEMSFQAVTNHEKIGAKSLKSCLDTEDYGTVYMDYGQDKAIRYDCSCGKPELTHVDRAELDGLFEIRPPKMPVLLEFDAFEVGPVEKIVHDDGSESFVATDESSDNIYCWSVFGHLPKGGVKCLADCPDQAIAESIKRTLDSYCLGR